LDEPLLAAEADEGPRPTKSRATLIVENYQPERNHLPPPKYKLTIIIIILVYLALWFGENAGLVRSQWPGISPGFSLFIFLCIANLAFVYAALDVFNSVLTVKVGGREYGIIPWLRQPRATWPLKYECFICEVIAGLIHILEDGFEMFNVPEDPSALVANQPIIGDSDEENQNQGYVELVIEHAIMSSTIEEYTRWSEKIESIAKRKAHGMIAFSSSSSSVDQANSISKEDANIKDGDIRFKVRLLFRDMQSLNAWLVCPRRRCLMEELQHYIAKPSAQILQTQREIPDAFTDLATQQGRPTPTRPPKKWKVWWLSTISLFISIKWVPSLLSYYFKFWGIEDASPRILDGITLPITVFVVGYIVNPFLLLLFNNWLKRKQHEIIDEKEPWRTLNEGIAAFWLKVVIAFSLYGGMLIVWLIQDPTFH